MHAYVRFYVVIDVWIFLISLIFRLSITLDPSQLLSRITGITLQRGRTEGAATAPTPTRGKLEEAREGIGCTRNGIAWPRIEYNDNAKYADTEETKRKI